MVDTKTYTPNYNLVKPGQDDFYNVDDFNSNVDKIDDALHQHANAAAPHPGHAKTGFGLGTFAEPLQNINIDTVVACGFYLAYNNCTNIPSVEGHYLLVEAFNANYIKQTATNMSTGVIKVRFRISGTWYDWNQIPTMDLVAVAGSALSSINLNTITTTGFYWADNECTNRPTANNGYLIVQKSTAANYTKQTYVDNAFTGYWIRTQVAGTWGAWKRITTEDITLTDKSYAPANWNAILTPGVYLVVDDNPTGQTNTAPQALGMYKYGQLVVTMAGTNTSVQQTYYSHVGTYAARQSFDGGATWQPWKQIPTRDMVAPSGYGLGTGSVPFNNDFNDMTTNGFFGTYNIGLANAPTSNEYYLLLVQSSPDRGWVSQTAYSYNLTGTNPNIYRRQFINGTTWSAWKQIPTMDLVAPAGHGLGEDVNASHTITLNSTSTKTGFFYYANTDPNRPDSGDGQIIVQSFNNTSIKQIAFSWTGEIYRRQYSSSMWSEWKRIPTADNVTNVTVLTGTVAHGGTIPLPSGYTEAQCHWMVSGNHMYDSSGGGYSDCSANGTRVVTATNTTGNTGTANYMIIGVK